MVQSCRFTFPHTWSSLNLLPPAIFDELVHPLAQVPQEWVGPQGAPGLLTLLQLLLQQGKAVQQLVQDQGQGRAGALGQEHHVDAWPQGQAVHGVGHHGAVSLLHTGIQENPLGAESCWGARNQRLEGVFSDLDQGGVTGWGVPVQPDGAT